METFNEWLELIQNLTAIARDTFHLVRDVISPPDLDSEKRAYRQRVRTRKKNGEVRPEWDAIGKCVWFDAPDTPNDIQMQYVPQPVQDTFTTLLNLRKTTGANTEFSQTTSDQMFTYLMEAYRFPGGACVLFWAKPN